MCVAHTLTTACMYSTKVVMLSEDCLYWVCGGAILCEAVKFVCIVLQNGIWLVVTGTSFNLEKYTLKMKDL